jgi:type III secretory pathway lipoprotein EscJ
VRRLPKEERIRRDSEVRETYERALVAMDGLDELARVSVVMDLQERKPWDEVNESTLKFFLRLAGKA